MAWLVSVRSFLRKVTKFPRGITMFPVGESQQRGEHGFPPQSHKHGRALVVSTWDKKTTSWLVSQQCSTSPKNHWPQRGSWIDRFCSCRTLKTRRRLHPTAALSRGERLAEAQKLQRSSLSFPKETAISRCISQKQLLGSLLFDLHL